MTWRDYLNASEAARIGSIPDERRSLTAEYKAIYERCRKRMERERENAGELSPETRTKPPVTD